MRDDDRSRTASATPTSLPPTAHDGPDLLAHIAVRTTNGVVLTDVQGKITWVNEGFTRITGYRLEEALGKTPGQLLQGPQSSPQARAYLRERISQKQPFVAELVNYRKSGEAYVVRVEGEPLFDVRGEHVGFLGIELDVSERRRAAEALVQSEEHLRIALQVARMGSFKIDLQTRQVSWSEPIKRVLATLHGGELTTIDQALTLLSPGDALRLQQALAQAKIDGAPFEIEHDMRFADGTNHIVRTAVHPRRDESGKVVEAYGLTQEITEQVLSRRHRARLQERVENAQRLEAFGQLAGSIGNDFSNLLTGILAEASLARMEAPNALVAQSLARIETLARQMSDLSRKLLTYAGKTHVAIERLEGDAVISSSADLLRRTVAREATLLLNPHATGARIMADASLLLQVLLNLVRNASEALPEGRGSITITTRTLPSVPRHLASGDETAPPHGWWELDVTDTGTGIEPSLRPHIFDPFCSTKEPGRGLGLAAVHGAVRRLGGYIDVESQPGKGSTFAIGIPLSEPHQMPRIVTRAALVADDEEPVREVIARILKQRGYAVMVALDGIEAEARLKSQPGSFSLVVLDRSMPGKRTDELVAIVRLLHPEAKVLVVSGFEESDGPASGKLHDAFLGKPFGYAELTQTLKTLDR